MTLPVLIAVALAALTVAWLLARSRIGRIVLAGFIALVALGLVGGNVARRRLQEIPVREVTVTGAASEVGAGKGSVRIVVVYDPSCGQCREVVPQIARYARRRARDRVRLYAFALTDDADEIRTMLADDPALFDAYRLLPYRPGELGGAMQAVDVVVPRHFATPFVSVLAGDGTRIGSWEGVADLSEVGAAVDAAIAKRPGSPRP